MTTVRAITIIRDCVPEPVLFDVVRPFPASRWVQQRNVHLATRCRLSSASRPMLAAPDAVTPVPSGLAVSPVVREIRIGQVPEHPTGNRCRAGVPFGQPMKVSSGGACAQGPDGVR